VLRLWCYRYTSGIIWDHSIIQVWIFHSKSWIITWISWLDQPSGSVHLLVVSSSPYLCITGPTTAIEPSAYKMCIICRSVLVVWSLMSMAIPYRQESLFLDAEQTAILSCSNSLVLGRWGVVNIKPLLHLEIDRVIYEISKITNHWYIGVLTTEWTYTNQPLFRPHLLGLGRMGLAIYMS